jgi:hypothetical protein
MQDQSTDSLDLRGLSLTNHAARALFLAIRGLSACGMCKGMGGFDPGFFNANIDGNGRKKDADQVCMCICVCACVFVCMYVCVYACSHVYMYGCM